MSKYKVERLDHLGLIAGMCDELCLEEYLNSKLSAVGKDKNLSYGMLIKSMILNGLGYVSQPLHMFPEYLKDKPLCRLFGREVAAEDFNQYALGRALDALFSAGVSELYTGFALKVVKHLKLNNSSLHLDSTSFHVDGNHYNDDEDTQVVQLKQGYSRDHRPDLNQIILNLIVENQSGIPLFLQVNDGNSSDKSNFATILKDHISCLKSALDSRYIVGDSAMCTPNSLTAIANSGGYFVTRVPSTLSETKQHIINISKAKLTKLEDGYSYSEALSNYAEIKQRWLIIFSQKAFDRESKTLDKNILKGSESESKELWHLENQIFACEIDAQKALAKFVKKSKYVSLADIKIMAHPRYKDAGKPAKDKAPDYFEYKIQANSYMKLSTRTELQQELGFFIITTNDLDQDKFPPLIVLKTYKSQQTVERGFRFLKSPEFLTSSFYLKNPRRIEALLCIMTMCLLIYSALEYKIRQELAIQNKCFPDQKKKDTQYPTARWVFFCFQGVSVVLEHSNPSSSGIITNTMDRQLIILRLLGSTDIPHQRCEFKKLSSAEFRFF